MHELYELDLRNGPHAVRRQVRELLCSITQDLQAPTEALNGLILNRVRAAMESPILNVSSALVSSSCHVLYVMR